MVAGRFLALSATQILLILGYSGHLAADNHCPDASSKSRPISTDNPHFGYRPRETDRIYPDLTEQEKTNADLRRSARDSGAWRQPEQSDCTPSPWVRPEDRGYRPRNIPSPEPARPPAYQQRSYLPYALPRPDYRMSTPAYPGIGAYEPYGGARRAPPVYDPRLYQPYPISPYPRGSSADPTGKKPRDTAR